MRLTPDTPDREGSTWGNELANAIANVMFAHVHAAQNPLGVTQSVVTLAELLDQLISELDEQIDGKLDAP